MQTIRLRERLNRFQVAPFVQRDPVVFLKLGSHFGRENLVVGFAEQEFQRRVKDTFGSRIRIDIPALQILHPRRTGQMPHEKRKPLFTVLERRVRQFQFRGALADPRIEILVAFPEYLFDVAAGG